MHKKRAGFGSLLLPFFLFPKIKFQLKNRRFDIVEEIQREAQMVLNTLKEPDFQGCSKRYRSAGSGALLLKGQGTVAKFKQRTKGDFS